MIKSSRLSILYTYKDVYAVFCIIPIVFERARARDTHTHRVHTQKSLSRVCTEFDAMSG